MTSHESKPALLDAGVRLSLSHSLIRLGMPRTCTGLQTSLNTISENQDYIAVHHKGFHTGYIMWQHSTHEVSHSRCGRDNLVVETEVDVLLLAPTGLVCTHQVLHVAWHGNHNDRQCEQRLQPILLTPTAHINWL